MKNRKDDVADNILAIVIILLCIGGLVAFGYFNYWIITSPNIPDCVKWWYFLK